MQYLTKDLTVIKEDERKFRGFVSVEEVDKVGDYIPIEEIEKVMDTIMKRGGFVIDSHSNRVVGKILNWQKTDKEGRPAITITGEIFKDWRIDDNVWDAIKSGKYRGLSFGGANKQKEFKEVGEQKVKILKDLEGYEVSVCENPANKEAVITEFNSVAKSVDVDSSVIGNVCEKCGRALWHNKNEPDHEIEKKDDVDNSKCQTYKGDIAMEKINTQCEMKNAVRVPTPVPREYKHLLGGKYNPPRLFAKDGEVVGTNTEMNISEINEKEGMVKEMVDVKQVSKVDAPLPAPAPTEEQMPVWAQKILDALSDIRGMLTEKAEVAVKADAGTKIVLPKSPVEEAKAPEKDKIQVMQKAEMKEAVEEVMKAFGIGVIKTEVKPVVDTVTEVKKASIMSGLDVLKKARSGEKLSNIGIEIYDNEVSSR